MTPDMLNLQWIALALYPAGYFARQIMVERQRSPARRAGSSRPRWRPPQATGGVTTFKPVSLDTLVDSPMFAGRYFKRLDLDPGGAAPVHLDVVADRAGSAGGQARAARSAPRSGAAGLQTLRLAPLRSL